MQICKANRPLAQCMSLSDCEVDSAHTSSSGVIPTLTTDSFKMFENYFRVFFLTTPPNLCVHKEYPKNVLKCHILGTVRIYDMWSTLGSALVTSVLLLPRCPKITCQSTMGGGSTKFSLCNLLIYKFVDLLN